VHLATEQRMKYQMFLNVSEVTKVVGSLIVVPHSWQQSGWVSMDCHVSITFSPSFLHGLICSCLGLSSACLGPSQDCSPLTHFFCHCAMCHRVQVRNCFTCTQVIGMIFICRALYCTSQIYSMESLVDTAPPPTVWGSLTFAQL